MVAMVSSLSSFGWEYRFPESTRSRVHDQHHPTCDIQRWIWFMTTLLIYIYIYMNSNSTILLYLPTNSCPWLSNVMLHDSHNYLTLFTRKLCFCHPKHNTCNISFFFFFFFFLLFFPNTFFSSNNKAHYWHPTSCALLTFSFSEHYLSWALPYFAWLSGEIHTIDGIWLLGVHANPRADFFGNNRSKPQWFTCCHLPGFPLLIPRIFHRFLKYVGYFSWSSLELQLVISQTQLDHP